MLPKLDSNFQAQAIVTPQPPGAHHCAVTLLISICTQSSVVSTHGMTLNVNNIWMLMTCHYLSSPGLICWLPHLTSHMTSNEHLNFNSSYTKYLTVFF